MYFEGYGTLYERLARKDYLKFLLERFDIQSVLEVKSGIGLDSSIFFDEGRDVALIESREEYIREFKKIWNSAGPKLIRADFLSLPFKQESFDLVWSSCLIDNVSNPGEYILEMRRVSKRFVLLFASNDFYFTHIIPKFTKKGPKHWINTRSLPRMIESCKLRIIDRGGIDSPPWPSGFCLPKIIRRKIGNDSYSMDSNPPKILKNIVSFEKKIPMRIKNFTGHQVFVLAEKGEEKYGDCRNSQR